MRWSSPRCEQLHLQQLHQQRPDQIAAAGVQDSHRALAQQHYLRARVLLPRHHEIRRVFGLHPQQHLRLRLPGPRFPPDDRCERNSNLHHHEPGLQWSAHPLNFDKRPRQHLPVQRDQPIPEKKTPVLVQLQRSSNFCSALL